MENELQDTLPQIPSKKGNLLAKIGLGIVGEIAAVFLALVVFTISNTFDNAMQNAFIAYCLFRIVCVSEGVRLGGVRSGGHRRRLLCYMGTTLGSLLPWASLLYSLILWYSPSEPWYGAGSDVFWAGIIGLPFLGLTGAIVGYNLDAKREEKSLAHASEEENPALSSHNAMP